MEYQSLIEKFGIKSIRELYELFDQEIIYDWIKLYEGMSEKYGEITIQNFYGYTFTIDDGNQFIPAGKTPKEMLEGRVVAVYGISNNKINHGNRKMMRKWIGNTGEVFRPYGDNYDKGHFIAHGFGGPIDVNLFRSGVISTGDGATMENPTGGWKNSWQLIRARLFFSRPLYTDQSFCPTALEYGYCDVALNFTVKEFPNR